MGSWEPDVQMSKGDMARFLALDYLISVTVVGLLVWYVGEMIDIYFIAMVTMIPLVMVLYWAFLYDYITQSRFARRQFDLQFGELVNITTEVLEKEGWTFRRKAFLADGVPAEGAGRLKRWNYSKVPHFTNFTLDGQDIRLRVYRPRYRKMKTCSIVLGPFEGAQKQIVEHLRRELDWKLDAYGLD